MPGRRRFAHGYTLLELALTLALLALLVGFAIPAYRGYIDRVNESRAITDIQGLAIELHRWKINNGKLPETLADAGLGGGMDPWGRPYAYLNIATAPNNAVRKDKNLHPLNTDFDLYSVGRDGDSKLPLTAKASRDDIIRANNGAYVGRGEDYSH